MKTICLLLLLISTVPVDSLLTKFYFSGNLFCDFEFAAKDDFVFDVTVHEEDSTFFKTFNDEIGLKDTLSITRRYRDDPHPYRRKTMSYSIEAQDTGDGIGSSYEVYLMIKHNCNEKREIESKKVYIQQYLPIKDGNLFIREPINITSESEKKREIGNSRI